MERKDLTYSKSGFRIPENYFEELDENIMAIWAKNLHSKGKIVSGFALPKNYFEKLEIKPPNKKEIKVIPLFSRKIYTYAASIAAMLLLLLTISQDYSMEKNMFSTIDDTSIKNYIENDNIDFLNLEIQNFITTGTNLSGMELSGIEKDALFHYLMENSDELSYGDY